MRPEPRDQFVTNAEYFAEINRLRAMRLVVLLYLVAVCLIGANI